MKFDAELVQQCRSQFPALARESNGQPVVYFDGPAGTQVPQRVADAMSDYLLRCNANHEGNFATSRESDALLHDCHRAAADLLGVDDADTVSFGPNMTTLTFALSRSLARQWEPGDEVVVTRLDHDANVTPWVLAAKDAGATVRYIDFDHQACQLDLDQIQATINAKTKLVAVGCASNSTGTVNPVRQISDWAHEVGALTFLDAVHFAPHRLIDIPAWDCDFLVCSAYKFFGPHIGIQWGRRELLEALQPYKLRPAPDALPGRWMTGTQSHEGIAGTMAAIDYLADIGRSLSGDQEQARRPALETAMSGIREYEDGLCAHLLRGLGQNDDVTIYGMSNPDELANRVPTLSIRHAKYSPRDLAIRLDEAGIYVWDGNYYALNVTESLGLEPEGMVRIGLVHYNTADEVDRLLSCLQ